RDLLRIDGLGRWRSFLGPNLQVLWMLGGLRGANITFPSTMVRGQAVIAYPALDAQALAARYPLSVHFRQARPGAARGSIEFSDYAIFPRGKRHAEESACITDT